MLQTLENNSALISHLFVRTTACVEERVGNDKINNLCTGKTYIDPPA